MAEVTALGHRVMARHRLLARSAGRLLRAAATPPIRSSCFASSTTRAGRSRRASMSPGRRRAHRLRPAHAAAAGRRRRPAGAHEAGLDRGAAGAGIVRLQHRRHARSHDGRPLPEHAASRAPQHQRPRSAVVPAVLRSRLRRPHRADPECRHRRSAPRAGTARACTRSRAATATTCSPRSARCSRNCARAAAGGAPRCQRRIARCRIGLAQVMRDLRR